MAESTPTDALVAAVLAGDGEAFRGLVEAHAPRLRVVVAAMLPSRAQVDDVVQEAFLVAYARLRDYTPGSDLLAWLLTIARNTALNERRRIFRLDQARAAYRERIERACAAHELVDGDDAVVAGLRACLERLSPAARGAVEQFYFQRRSVAETAAACARTGNWVEVTLHRARKALADCLRDKGFVHG